MLRMRIAQRLSQRQCSIVPTSQLRSSAATSVPSLSNSATGGPETTLPHAPKGAVIVVMTFFNFDLWRDRFELNAALISKSYGHCSAEARRRVGDAIRW